MNESNMPWNNLNKKDKSKIWTITKWCLIIIGVLVVAVGLGYFGTKFWSKSDQSDTPIVSNSTTAPTAASDTTSTTPATTAPTPVVTGTTTTPTVSSTTSTPATPAPATTPATTPAPTPASTASTVAPQVDSIYTSDYNANGKIDEMDIYFKITDKTVAGCGIDTSVASTAGFSVKGYTIKSAQWSKGGSIYDCPSSRGEPSHLALALKEGDSYDTDATPIVTYQASLGKIKSKSSVPLASFDLKSEDKTSPALISAAAVDANSQPGIQTGDNVVLTFSEPLKIDATEMEKAFYMDSAFELDNSSGDNTKHSWYSASGQIGPITLSSDKKTVTVSLSAVGGAPTIQVGDYLQTDNGDSPQDFAGNGFLTNDIKITGSF